ncbi:MAG: exodeoxyribonuclease VII small subunit [Rubrivivax sp.]|jgi:exodeoxyribonuclease VII small subunit
MSRTSPRPPSDADSIAGELSYEAAVAELEQLVAAMEGGQMPLDRLLEGYKRGAQLLALCRSRLKAVEDQVQVLEDGQLKPLEVGRG